MAAYGAIQGRIKNAIANGKTPANIIGKDSYRQVAIKLMPDRSSVALRTVKDGEKRHISMTRDICKGIVRQKTVLMEILERMDKGQIIDWVKEVKKGTDVFIMVESKNPHLINVRRFVEVKYPVSKKVPTRAGAVLYPAEMAMVVGFCECVLPTIHNEDSHTF